jgi:hypothetical protein
VRESSPSGEPEKPLTGRKHRESYCYESQAARLVVSDIYSREITVRPVAARLKPYHDTRGRLDCPTTFFIKTKNLRSCVNLAKSSLSTPANTSLAAPIQPQFCSLVAMHAASSQTNFHSLLLGARAYRQAEREEAAKRATGRISFVRRWRTLH